MKKIIALCTIALFTIGAESALKADIVDNSGAGFAIPDNNTTGASSTISIGANEIINGNVSLSIIGLSHTWVGDLNATLTGPGGSATIMLRTGSDTGTGAGDSSNLGGDYTFADSGANFWAAAAAGTSAFVIPTGTYQASTTGAIGVGTPVLLNPIFAGTSTLGDWTLSISDNAGFDTGGFTSWGISIESAAAIPEPASALVLICTVALAVVRRRR